MATNHTDAFNAIMKSKQKPKAKPVFVKPTGLDPDHPLSESLSKCTVGDNCVFLPPISDGVLPDYAEIRKALINAGGKYNKNKFEFPNDPMPYLLRITGGEKVNIKKEFQFFPTPLSLAKRMVEFADIDADVHTILEPSAGQGAIVNAILEAHPEAVVHCFELMDINRTVLETIPNCVIIGEDFLKPEKNTDIWFDRIIANPPFAKNQDIDHIREMYKRLNSGGILVTIASRHWYNASGKKEKEFHEWLLDIEAEIDMLDQGLFKESGTTVPTILLTIHKQ